MKIIFSLWILILSNFSMAQETHQISDDVRVETMMELVPVPSGLSFSPNNVKSEMKITDNYRWNKEGSYAKSTKGSGSAYGVYRSSDKRNLVIVSTKDTENTQRAQLLHLKDGKLSSYSSCKYEGCSVYTARFCNEVKRRLKIQNFSQVANLGKACLDLDKALSDTKSIKSISSDIKDKEAEVYGVVGSSGQLKSKGITQYLSFLKDDEATDEQVKKRMNNGIEAFTVCEKIEEASYDNERESARLSKVQSAVPLSGGASMGIGGQRRGQ